MIDAKRSSPVLLIGVAGGSGSGKSTFARMLQANLGEGFCGILAQDFYYRDLHEYFDRDGGAVNFDHPNAVEFDLFIQHLKDLREGRDIEVPRYDFVSHRRLFHPYPFLCRPVVIAEGTLLLTQSEVRPLLDFAFFIDTQEDLRLQRRLTRDVRERGRSADGVREQFARHVKPMHDLFVNPSRRFADRVISGERSFGPVIEEVIFGLKESPLGICSLR